jgi:hypothetical protein
LCGRYGEKQGFLAVVCSVGGHQGGGCGTDHSDSERVSVVVAIRVCAAEIALRDREKRFGFEAFSADFAHSKAGYDQIDPVH